MSGKKGSRRCMNEEPEQQLRDIREEAEYYRQLSEEAGKRSVREINKLSVLFTEHKEIGNKLKYKLALDLMISTISTRFLQLSPGEIDEGIIWALGLAGEFYRADFCCVYEFSQKEKKAVNTYRWYADHFIPDTLSCISIPAEDLSAWMEKFYLHEPFHFNDTATIGNEVLREFFESKKIRALFSVPMYYKDTLMGFICFVLLKHERTWSEDDVIMSRTLSDIFMNTLQRKRIEEEREHLENQLQIRQRMDSLVTLAGGIAHDFNNLLAAIMGNIDLLLMDSGQLTNTQKRYLTGAYQSSQRAAKLIGGIQTLSKGSVLYKMSVDIYSIAEEVFGILGRTTDKLIDKRIHIKPGQFYVYVNADQLHQVLLNLGTNSIHAIEEKGVKPGDYIYMSAQGYTAADCDKKGLAPGEYIHIMFEDNGTGMTQKVKEKAFDPLFTTRMGAQKGQGLGLTMVYNIVTRNHSGHVDIETAPGKGTIFHIYLPRASESDRNNFPDEAEIHGGCETILVIEDEDSVREYVAEALKKFGYNVITAIDGVDGLYKFMRKMDIIDLVLLDMILPRMSGKMVMESIIDRKPDTKLIITSGHSEEELQNCSPAHGFLPKPYKISLLAKTVRTILDSK
ncbi:response regulator [bacterium]|nr:response regulator [bacterium]